MTGGPVAVVGAGAWGTALACAAASAGVADVRLIARDDGFGLAMAAARENTRYLPGTRLPGAVAPSADMGDVSGCQLVLLAVPAQAVRTVAAALRPSLAAGAVLLCCAKGIELGSGLMLTEVLAEAAPGQPLAVLSGPSFAGELARGQPTAVTLAAGSMALAEALAGRLGSRSFRPYASDDIIGAEVGGALKNVLAIAAGIAAGQGYGENTRAALITRGLAEIARFAHALGGRPETLMGLSGLGDIVLTCSSPQSRNYALGLALGDGRPLAALTAPGAALAEGVPTAAAVVRRAARLGVEMPIAAAVDGVLNHGLGLRAAIDGLLARPIRREGEG